MLKNYEELLFEDWLKFNSSDALMEAGIETVKDILRPVFDAVINTTNQRELAACMPNMTIKYVIMNKLCKKFYGDILVAGSTVANILFPFETPSMGELSFIVKDNFMEDNTSLLETIDEVCNKLKEKHLIQSFDVDTSDVKIHVKLCIYDNVEMGVYFFKASGTVTNYAFRDFILHCVPIVSPEYALCRIIFDLFTCPAKEVPYYYKNALELFRGIEFSTDLLKEAKEKFLFQEELLDNLPTFKQSLTRAYENFTSDKENCYIQSSRLFNSFCVLDDTILIDVIEWIIKDDFAAVVKEQKKYNPLVINSRPDMIALRN